MSDDDDLKEEILRLTATSVVEREEEEMGGFSSLAAASERITFPTSNNKADVRHNESNAQGLVDDPKVERKQLNHSQVPTITTSASDDHKEAALEQGERKSPQQQPVVMAQHVKGPAIIMTDSSAVLMAEEVVSGTTPKQLELISGLMVKLSEDAEINMTDDGYLSVRSSTASLGDSFLRARGVRLEARIAASEVQNMVTSLEGMTLDPLVTRDKLQDFLDSFGLPKAKENRESSAPRRKSRLSREEWEQFLLNVQTNTTPNSATLIPPDSGLSQKLDLKIPNAQVKAVQCQLPSHNATMDFEDCKGSEGATVRTLLEYYARSILNKMDVLSGNKADVSISAVASDVASVKASMVGASVGAVLLGPAGFVAGSYLGNRWMRQSSLAVNGGVAGLTLFGPVGLVAGVVATEGQAAPAQHQPRNSTKVDETGRTQRRSVVEATADKISANKYEYAGSAGVYTGAAVGMAIAGPVGLVAGCLAGSMSGRKLVEAASSSARRDGNDETTRAGDEPYRFGDFKRGIVARGKESRLADAEEGYRFGDFTRGLFSRKHPES